jgi:hypothetical protein
MSGVPPENEVRVMLNRSAVVVKPKQTFLDWVHSVDPTSGVVRGHLCGAIEQLVQRYDDMANGSQLRGVLPLV